MKKLNTNNNFLFHDLNKNDYPVIYKGKGNFLFDENNRKIMDASGGAAVSCLGYNNKKLEKALITELKKGIPYLASYFWKNKTVDNLCKLLIKTTNEKMTNVYLAGSGSEATEAAIKIAMQYYKEKGEKTRKYIISRKESYHGNTMGALSISGHLIRRKLYEDNLMKNVHHIPSYNPYHQKRKDESEKMFINRKIKELENKFKELGPHNILAVFIEPISGAALGCITPFPGYLKGIQKICNKYGALLIADEIMCGIGRTGDLHVWQAENFEPDIQLIGKALSGGYQQISAILTHSKISKVIQKGSGQFIHGHTYQSMPIQAAVATKLLEILLEDNKKILSNVSILGDYLGKKLKNKLNNHPNVGDIRGRGFFWGIEFINDKTKKIAFDPSLQIAKKIQNYILKKYDMSIYMGTGTVDGLYGDHIIIAPSYLCTKKDINFIIKIITKSIIEFFSIQKN